MSVEQGPAPARQVGRWDHVLTELNRLRATRGEPSFAELTRTLIKQRVAEGQDPHAARISKSSVHDAFRMGRTRINLGLTRELVRALGEDPGLVDHWLAAPASAPTGTDAKPEVALDGPVPPVAEADRSGPTAPHRVPTPTPRPPTSARSSR